MTEFPTPTGQTINEMVRIADAGRMLNLSRATFWRFRKRHRIRTLPGATLWWSDVSEALKAEREGKRRYHLVPESK